jgi:hypothetical protein
MPPIARHLTLLAGMLFVLFLAACSSGGGDSSDATPLPAPTQADTTTFPTVKIEVERLPDLNIPRSSHTILNVGGR